MKSSPYLKSAFTPNIAELKSRTKQNEDEEDLAVRKPVKISFRGTSKKFKLKKRA